MSRPEKRWLELEGGELDPAPSLAVRNHSPTGFSWGYHGSGPKQLALALMLMAGASIEECEDQGFKYRFVSDVVSRWDMQKGWELTAGTLTAFLQAYQYIAAQGGHYV